MLLVSRFAAAHADFPLSVVTSPASQAIVAGKKSAIERAVRLAKGEVLLLTDADTFRESGWISSMVSGFNSPQIRMVMGPVCFCNEKNLLQKVQTLEFMGLMGATAGSAALGFPVMCNGANMAYRRDAFFMTGGFGSNLKYASGDDQFMMAAIRKQYGKGSLVFNADQQSGVSTEPEATLLGFLNQRLRWVSKSRGYRDPAVIIVGIITYLSNVLLLAGMLLGIFFPALFLLAVFLWLLKILLEYPMVLLMTRFFVKKKLKRHYFTAQAFQLVYVPLAGMLGLVLPFRWKGRKG
jgi:cellulose synthase/poly-beta-1,6-N-acetylglucosamine synthase-like glycosyltransferase